MSDLDEVKEKMKGISLTATPEERGKRKATPNYSDEQLALRQPIKKVEIPEEHKEFLLKILLGYIQVVAYYQKDIPYDNDLDPDILEFYMKYSGESPEEAIRKIVTDIVQKKCEKGEFPSDTPLKDRATLVQYIEVIIHERIRELNRL